jgi:hypothetical protein
LSAFSCFAQGGTYKDSLVAARIRQLEVFWNKYHALSDFRTTYEPYSAIPALFKTTGTDTFSISYYRNKVNEAKIKQLKQDVGVDVSASFLENFDPGVTDDNMIYRSRFQAGLDWNILSDGYFENRRKQKVLENQSMINSLSPEESKDNSSYITLNRKIIYSFNVHKIRHIEKRQQIINDKINIANELYLLKQISRADLLYIMQQQADINSMLRVYGSYNDELKIMTGEMKVAENVLPLFDLDFAKLFSYSDKQNNDSLLKLKMENIRLQHTFLDDIKLSTQLRYNYYDLTGTSTASRSFLSAGIGMSVPLPLGIRSDKAVAEAEARLMSYEHSKNSEAEAKDLLGYFYEFRYKLKQYTNFYEKKKKYEELLRVERVKEKLDDYNFNPLAALNLLDDLLSIEIELLDIQQQLYLQLVDIKMRVPEMELETSVVPFIADTNASAKKMERSMYIWSEAQLKYGVSYIEEYLRLNGVSNAILSARKDQSNKTALLSLLPRLKSSSISAELMVGSNKLLSDPKPLSYLDSVLSGIDTSLVKTLHLDVEPHTLADWQDKKDLYLQQYIELLKKVKGYCGQKGMVMTVSIPVFYPESTLKEIYALSDKVYIMAYEHTDAAYILRKAKEELAAGAEKTIIAVRAKDFKNRSACETLIKELTATLGDKIAMHDLETFISLDEQSVNGDK